MRQILIALFYLFIAGQNISIYSQQIPVLNLASALERPINLTLSDFVESITYIPLETTYDCLVDKNPAVFISKEFIVTLTAHRCLVFERKNGKFIREIARYGRGPGEYQSSKGLLNESVPAYYFTGWNGYLVKYTMDGAFRGNIKVPGYKDSFDSPSVPMNYSFINDSIIVCDFLIGLGTEPKSLMIFSENGRVLKDFPNTNILKSKQNFVIRTGEMRFHHYNKNLFFQSMYNDTVFRISTEKLTPYFILDRGKQSPPFESKWWSYEKQLKSNFISLPVYFENKRFISFNFYTGRNVYLGLYDKSIKSLKVTANPSGITNNVDGFVNLTFDSINSEGELIGLIQANDLVKWREKNTEKFNGLAQVLQKFKNVESEDNPIIVIAKYRE